MELQQLSRFAIVLTTSFLFHLSEFHETRIGKFVSNSNYDNLFPSDENVFLAPTLDKNRLGCALTCQDFPECEGFMSNVETKKCRLLREILGGQEFMSTSQGWRYYNRKNGNYIEILSL